MKFWYYLSLLTSATSGALAAWTDDPMLAAIYVFLAIVGGINAISCALERELIDHEVTAKRENEEKQIQKSNSPG